MKYFLLSLYIIGTVLTLVRAGSQSAGNDYMWGSIDPATDLLIARATVTQNLIPLMTVTKDYIFDQTGNASPKTISAVKVRDLKRIKGASVELVSGGVGAQAVTLRFTSQRGFSIKDVVEIYGK